MSPASQKILATLCYADVFDCALSEQEIFVKLQTNIPIAEGKVHKILGTLVQQKKILYRDGFYCLPERIELLSQRRVKLTTYQSKIDRLSDFVHKIVQCPFIVGIYVTGSVAAKNCLPEDDVDVMVVCLPQRLWLARLWVIVVSEWLHSRRRPQTTKTRNTLCFNLWLETDGLAIGSKRQNLYTAHEVIQAQPVFVRDDVDTKFWDENEWVSSFLANASLRACLAGRQGGTTKQFPRIEQQRHRETKEQRNILNTTYKIPNTIKYTFTIILNAVNSVVFKLQYFYMKPKITHEVVDMHQAFFHPRDTKNTVMKAFSTRKKQFGLV